MNDRWTGSATTRIRAPVNAAPVVEGPANNPNAGKKTPAPKKIVPDAPSRFVTRRYSTLHAQNSRANRAHLNRNLALIDYISLHGEGIPKAAFTDFLSKAVNSATLKVRSSSDFLRLC